MFGLFYQYLISNKKAGISGIGIFSIDRKPARLDFANKVFVSPDLQINFSTANTGNDLHFYKYVSVSRRIDEAEAVRIVDDFAKRLKENLSLNKMVELPAVGRLFYNTLGEVQFEATQRLKTYFPDAAAQRIVRQNAEHSILVGDTSHTNTQMQERLDEDKSVNQEKDYWLPIAIILGLIAIAFIVYYYISNGSLQ